MKSLINKTLLTALLLSQAMVHAEHVITESQMPKTWREKTENFYEKTAQDLNLFREYLGARYEIAKDDAKEKLEQLNQKFKKAKEWVKKNPKKTAAGIAALIFISSVAIRKLQQPKYATTGNSNNNMTPKTVSLSKEEYPEEFWEKLPNVTGKNPNQNTGANPGKQEIDPYTTTNYSNVVGPDHTYASLFNPDNEGTGVKPSENYPDLNLKFQYEFAQDIHDACNDMANSIPPKYSYEEVN